MTIVIVVKPKVQNIVFVHGSCHGGWCWKKVLPFFDPKQFHVYTPTLTGLGDRCHLVSESTDLYTHIEDVLQLFRYEDLSDVILVGHSYAGMVINGVAEVMPEKIRFLIYLDAYIPQDGKTAFDLVPGLQDLYNERKLLNQNKPWLVNSYTPTEFGITDPQDIAWMEPKLVPMPWHTHDEPIKVQNQNARNIRRAFIKSAEFGEGMFQRQTKEEKNMWDYYEELNRGHDVMITAPEELSKMILDIILRI